MYVRSDLYRATPFAQAIAICNCGVLFFNGRSRCNFLLAVAIIPILLAAAAISSYPVSWGTSYAVLPGDWAWLASPILAYGTKIFRGYRKQPL